MWTGHLNTYPKGKVIYTCLKRGEESKARRGNRNPIRDIFCFGGKYVVLWGLEGVSVAIRLFKASQWECGGARLSPLPCPPTGTDGHPRSSLISLQSGNDPCSWDVAALFKYDARCSPTFSMSSHCPRKPEGEREKGKREHNIPQRSMCCGILCSLCCAYSSPFSSFVFFSLSSVTCSQLRGRNRRRPEVTSTLEKWCNFVF